MVDSSNLLEKIKTKKAKVGIIGLGYVGLPLALLFARKGFSVTGFMRNEKKVDRLMKGDHDLGEKNVTRDLRAVIKSGRFQAVLTNKDDLSKQDVLIVCVPTPVNEDKTPDLSDLLSVASQLKTIDATKKLIINESTVAPFTTRNTFGSLKGTYFLVSSPERVDPGNHEKTVNKIPKVVGGRDKESLALGKALYESVLDAEVITVGTLESAEMAKIMENTYRAVNIALVNEFARLAEKCDVDILEVIKAAKSKWSFHAHYPSVGVGGHCIPVDPYYLLQLADSKKVSMDVVAHGLEENEKMPGFVAQKVKKVYKKGMKVLVYGLAYKKDINDFRESPVIVLGNALKEKSIPFTVYDPHIKLEVIEKLGFSNGKLGKVDILIIGTDHSELKKDSHALIANKTVVIDGRNYFQTKVGKAVYGIGRTMV